MLTFNMGCIVICILYSKQVQGQHDSSKCLQKDGSGYHPDIDCTDCSYPPRQACANNYVLSLKKRHPCSVINCTPPVYSTPQVMFHDSRKCLEDNGWGYRRDYDCIDCYNPPRQACADRYVTVTGFMNTGCT